MKIDKAIEILQQVLTPNGPPITLSQLNAIMLGKEALKRLQDGRHKGYDYFGHLLPGETKD